MKVSVDFTESYDRIPHPDADLENSVSEVRLILLSFWIVYHLNFLSVTIHYVFLANQLD